MENFYQDDKEVYSVTRYDWNKQNSEDSNKFVNY
jgi:hypothetical protein